MLTERQLIALGEFWRRVQGPRAELNGPLIRFAGLVRRDALTQAADIVNDEDCGEIDCTDCAPIRELERTLRALASSEDQR